MKKANNPEASQLQAASKTTPHNAVLLIEAIEHQAAKRGRSLADLARIIGIHSSHWYRLKSDPASLARCERVTLDSIARFLDWPIGRVLLSSGVFRAKDFEVELVPQTTVDGALVELQRTPFGAGLQTPLKSAASDHQRLIAELYVSLQLQTIRKAPQAPAGG